MHGALAFHGAAGRMPRVHSPCAAPSGVFPQALASFEAVFVRVHRMDAHGWRSLKPGVSGLARIEAGDRVGVTARRRGWSL